MLVVVRLVVTSADAFAATVVALALAPASALAPARQQLRAEARGLREPDSGEIVEMHM